MGSRKTNKSSTLLANSINLMLSSGIIALFGFVFWTIVARSFRTSTVGLATTLLSMSTLLSLLGLAGFDTIFIRYLSRSKQKNTYINTGLIFTGIASVLVAILFCALIPLISPRLSFVDHNIKYLLSFVIFTVFTTWNALTNAAIVAYRKASFVVAINIVFSFVKLVLPFLIKYGGPMTIFNFTGIAQVVNVVLSVGVLMYYFKFRPSIRLDKKIFRKIRRYGFTVYIANTLNLLPDSALPLIVIDKLGAAAAAYFYVAFTIANLLYTIAFSTTQALLAEASHEGGSIGNNLRKSLKIISSILIPATLILIAVCPLILDIFGEHYRTGAVSVLRILSLSSIPIMIYSALGTIFKFTHNLKAILFTNSVNALSVIFLAFVAAKPWGLNGIGWAWLLGNLLSIAVGLYFVNKRRFNQEPSFKDAV